MKYIAIIDTDDYKDFEFFEDGNGKYMAVKDATATTSGGWIPLYFTECEQQSVLDKIIGKEVKSLRKDMTVYLKDNIKEANKKRACLHGWFCKYFKVESEDGKCR